MPPSALRLPLADRLTVRLLAWQTLTIDQAWNSADVCSTYWRLYYNDRAGASLALPRSRYAIVPGRLHFVPPWVRFSCHCQQPVRHFYIHFDTLGLPGGLIRDLFAVPCALDLDDGLAACLAPLLAEPETSSTLARQLTAKALVYGALAGLFARLPPEDADRCAMIVRGDHAVQPALAQIESHLAEPLSNRYLASLCHYSEDHFIRRFRQIMGQSPAQYVIERRVARAAQRLIFTPDSIDRIAQDGGFPNRYYFTRVFTRRLGVSPAAYREAKRV